MSNPLEKIRKAMAIINTEHDVIDADGVLRPKTGQGIVGPNGKTVDCDGKPWDGSDEIIDEDGPVPSDTGEGNV